MCGIAGCYAYRDGAPPIDTDELLRIRDAMTTRGPDGSGIWTGDHGRVGLAHRRLAIIDLSTSGAQPMASADGRLNITFNGEIYNYRELRRELEHDGVQFRSASDTEVLLHLYQRRGAEMVHDLRGMFAFAIWDERQKGLFLARDPFGIKPLYCSDDGATFRFASQVKALLKGGRVDTTPEPAGHAGFFLWGYVPEPFTLYKGIRALAAGTSLWVGMDGRKSESKFFGVTKEFAAAADAPFAGSRADAIDRIRHAINDSVGKHLVADVPVGVFLSAGLDSALIAGFASTKAPKRLRTITLGFDEFRGTSRDETILAKGVAQGFNTDHHTQFISRADFSAERGRLLAAMDQPSIDGVNTYLVSKVAAEVGLKVALSGIGGDELFGTYPSFRDVPAIARYFSPAQHYPSVGRFVRRVVSPIVGRLSSPKYAGLLEYGGSYAGAYILRRGLFMPWELPGLLSSSLSEAGLADLRTIDRLDEVVAGLKHDHARVSSLELEWYMRGQLLRDADWAGMAHSLEIRVPFVDLDVLRAFATIVGAQMKATKGEVASVFAKELPRQSLVRSKSGFAVPIRQWLHALEGRASPARGLRNWARKVNAEGSILGAKIRFKNVRKVLIYRLGSLGDTVVALPCFHVIARVFSQAERKVLTNFPVSSMAPPLQDVLGSSGLVQEYISYPQRLRQIISIWHLYRTIRESRPEILIYLTGYRGLLNTLRDAVFFRLCGISTSYGIPYSSDKWQYEAAQEGQGFERESVRLARTLDELVPIDVSDPRYWDLKLSPAELHAYDAYVHPTIGNKRFIACSVGTKVEVKDWGKDNWLNLSKRLAMDYSTYALVLLGAKEDWERSELLKSNWPAPCVNLCGEVTPRESAAILSHAILFLGHDSGPMHLAAAVGIKTVSIFSARALPGVWFPYGEGHKVLYHQTPCFGCGLEVCDKHAKKCIMSIQVDEVRDAVHSVLPPAVAKGMQGWQASAAVQ